MRKRVSVLATDGQRSVLITKDSVEGVLANVPELTIGTDRVDACWIERPHRWNVRFIRTFMLTFGALSSVFDYLTFGDHCVCVHR